MDASGIPAAKPHYADAKATYVTLVDPQNALSDALGFKVIPNGFLIDEAGVLQFMQVGGFDVKRQRSMTAVEDFLARAPVKAGAPAPKAPSDSERISQLKKTLSGEPGNAEAKLQLGKVYLRQGKPDAAMPLLKDAAASMAKSPEAQFALGSCLLAKGDKKAGVAQLRKALKLDSKNYVIRKQIWLVEHPEKFHPEIDWGWQREQLRKELAAEGGGG